jgi:rare lipoprotein A
LGLVAAFAVALSPVAAPARVSRRTRHAPERITGPAKPDLSARKRLGKASFYARQFFGRSMADGAPMNPRSNNAASRTLPLGTVAKVTDVATGKSAIVKIEDRGPYIKGRIVDLSPSTARKIGITPHIGVAKVVVAPIAVPLPDGRIKLGPAARRPNSRTSRRALSTDPKHSGAPHDEGRSAHGSRGFRAPARFTRCLPDVGFVQSPWQLNGPVSVAKGRCTFTAGSQRLAARAPHSSQDARSASRSLRGTFQ